LNLKQILESMVAELESIGAVVSAIQGVLIENKLCTPTQIESVVPNLQKELQRRLVGLRISIDKLPD
jgi:hypothetical protein